MIGNMKDCWQKWEQGGKRGARRQLLKLGQFHFIRIQLDNWTQHVDTKLDVNMTYYSKFGYKWIQICKISLKHEGSLDHLKQPLFYFVPQ